MSDEIQNSIVSEPKKKRSYVRKVQPINAVPPPIPQSQAINPAIVAMQNELLPLIAQREDAELQIGRIQIALQRVQGDLRQAQENVNRIDQTIQRRINIINQMQGGAPAISIPPVTAVPLHGGPWPPLQGYNSGYEQQSPTYAPGPPMPAYPSTFGQVPVPARGVGSAPGYPIERYPDVGGIEGVRTASAEEIRNDAVNRGY